MTHSIHSVFKTHPFVRYLLLPLIGILIAFTGMSPDAALGQGKGNGKGGGGNGGGGDDGGGGDPPVVAVDPGKIFYQRDRTSYWENNSIRSEGGGTEGSLFDTNEEIEGDAQPSEKQHAGRFWFLQVEKLGNDWCELYAVRADNTGRLQLTDSNDDLTVKKTLFGDSGLRWSQNDEVISFMGMRIDANGDAYEAGVYSAGVQFDQFGNITGLTAQPQLVLPTGIYPDSVSIDDLSNESVDLSGYDFTSDGSTIVWSPIEGGINVTHIATAVSLALTADGVSPDLSPDDTTVAFDASTANGGYLDLVELDGSDRRTIAAFGNSRKKSYRARLPFWSPAGNQLVFTRQIEDRWGSTTELFQVDATGNNLTLFADIHGLDKLSIGWRCPAVDRMCVDDWKKWFFPGTAGDGGSYGRAVAIQPDGKILVAGLVRTDVYQYSQDICVVRYHTDFSIDTSFGNNGIAVADFDTGAEAQRKDFARQLVLLADGSMIVTGGAFDYYLNESGDVRNRLHNVAVRFTADGIPDGHFFDPYDAGGWANARAIVQSDGKIMLVRTVSRELTVGSGYENTNPDIGFLRLNTDFTLDTSFGVDGEVWYDNPDGIGAWDVRQRSDERIMVAGRSGGAEGVAYFAIFTSDGSLQAEQFIDASGVGESKFESIVFDDNDNAYLFGDSHLTTDGSLREGIVGKVKPDGQLDIAFGDNGILRMDFALRNAILDNEGKFIGVSDFFGFGNFDANVIGTIARINNDFSTDTGFGEGGFVLITPPSDYSASIPYALNGVAVDANNRPVVCGKVGGGNWNGNSWLFRMNK